MIIPLLLLLTAFSNALRISTKNSKFKLLTGARASDNVVIPA